jgi:hypothetical protein
MAYRSYEPLARRLCKAVNDIMAAAPNAAVALSQAAKEINVTHQDLIDGAVDHAVQKGWLQAKGKPVHSLLLTATGLTAALKKK